MRREEGVSKGKDPGYLDLKAGPTLGLKAEHRVMPGTQVRLKMEPWIIVWLSISQSAKHNVMTNSHAAINCNLGAKKIWEFSFLINKWTQI